MKKQSAKLDKSWLKVIGKEFDQPYMHSLNAFLQAEKNQGKTIYPADENIFNALNSTPLNKVKVVILGQDPYHGPNQAHGLAFSVPEGVKIPPSLMNIFKELHASTGLPYPQHGCLQHWADSGILLLNATLTVEAGKAGSHQNKGWETFTDAVIKAVNDHQENITFMLWGNYAQKKGAMIDPQKHKILKAPHPSPLSAHRGFIGCGHFNQIDTKLIIQE